MNNSVNHNAFFKVTVALKSHARDTTQLNRRINSLITFIEMIKEQLMQNFYMRMNILCLIFIEKLFITEKECQICH